MGATPWRFKSSPRHQLTCSIQPDIPRRHAAAGYHRRVLAIILSTPAPEIIALRCGRLQLELVPATGGSVASFTRDGQPLFRISTATARQGREPLALAGFPLLPFASRIIGNEFEWQNSKITLAPTVPGEPFAIHGQGWRRAWDLVSASARRCELTLDHPSDCSAENAGDGWPWHYRAELVFELSESALRLSVAVTNLSDSDMPAGLGWHPYIHRGDATLTVRTEGRIRGAGDPAGGRRIPHQGFTSAAIADLDVDHGFYGWNRTAEIDWPARGVSLSITAQPPLDFLLIYTPPGEDYFCVEPVSNLPDAANWQDALANGWRALQPGKTLQAAIELRVRG